MSWTESVPRPRRSLAEWLTATRIASVANRWRGVGQLQTYFPALFSPPPRRIYQLAYLDEQNRAAFTAGFLAGKLASIRQVGKLGYGGAACWPEVLSELVGVYLLRLANRRWVLLLAPMPGRDAPCVLPLPSPRLLLLLLLSRKTILR